MGFILLDGAGSFVGFLKGNVAIAGPAGVVDVGWGRSIPVHFEDAIVFEGPVVPFPCLLVGQDDVAAEGYFHFDDVLKADVVQTGEPSADLAGFLAEGFGEGFLGFDGWVGCEDVVNLVADGKVLLNVLTVFRRGLVEQSLKDFGWHKLVFYV